MMTSEDIGLALAPLAERWWAAITRGVVAILFGIVAFAAPVASVVGLILVWGLFALANGALALVMAVRRARTGDRWGWFLFEGIVGVGAGLVALVSPGITAFVFVGLIAAWAILTGIAEVVAAVELRSLITGEWLLAAAGALSAAFGVLLLVYPTAGALAVVWILGAYAIAFGVLLVALGFQLKAMRIPGEHPRDMPRRRPPRREVPPAQPSAHA